MSSHIKHLHAFRGFAILSIVGAHAWSFAIFWTGSLDTPGLKSVFYTTEVLFHGGTLYFAFISGLLFSKVLAGRSWRSFFVNKVLYVFSPYIVISTVTIGLYWQFYLENAESNGEQIFFISSVLKSLPLGTASIQFWYIPVLFILFALTPLLYLIQRKVPWLMWIVAALPLLVSRTTFPDFLSVQTCVYFIGAYAFGMLLGQNYEQAMHKVAHHKFSLMLALAAVSFAILIQYVMEYSASGFYSSRQTFVYVQKALVCLLVLYWFRKWEGKLPKYLSTLGTYSFAIYFLHVIFIGFVILSLQATLVDYRTGGSMLALGILNFIVGIGASLMVAWVFRKLFGKHARKLIGA